MGHHTYLYHVQSSYQPVHMAETGYARMHAASHNSTTNSSETGYMVQENAAAIRCDSILNDKQVQVPIPQSPWQALMDKLDLIASLHGVMIQTYSLSVWRDFKSRHILYKGTCFFQP